MSVELVKPAEVLDPGQRSVREHTDEANREYHLLLNAGASIVEHAIRCGDALLAAEAQYIERLAAGIESQRWLDYLSENFDGGMNKAHTYIRFARYQDVVREHGCDTISGTMLHLTEIGAKSSVRRKRPPDWLLEEMKRLREEGWTCRRVGEHVGKHPAYVQYWTQPEEARNRSRAKASAHSRQQHAAAVALEEKKRNQAIKRAVRKAGAALAEAYTRAERDQDIIAQAQREETDTERKRLLSEAGAVQRKYRDLIVRALGVS